MLFISSLHIILSVGT